MRLHFTIRDLLWLTVVAAMGIAWWLDHRKQGEEIRYLKAPKLTPVHIFEHITNVN
jgi:hypothetical protein